MTTRRLQTLSPRAVDAGLVLAVAVAMTLSISVATEPGARPVDAAAYLFGLAVAGLLVLRRRWPMGVLVASAGLLFIYFGLDYPAFSPAVPLAAAAYNAAAAGHIRAAAVLLAGVVASGVAWQTLGEQTSLLSVLGINTLADAALLSAVLLLGEAVRNRRAWADEVRARMRRAEADREREAARRVEDERLRIARELHDVLAHTIAALNVQAGVAADLVEKAPDQARASLGAIREQSREAMEELRAAVGLLRDGTGEPPRAPSPGLAGLDGLVGTATAAGVAVDLSVDGHPRALPGVIDLTAYRIVQESLTNVVRHAHATSARVRLRYDPDAIVVQVQDDGRGTGDGEAGGGHGVTGMRERAAALGGTLEAGPAPGGGFRVVGRLPTRRVSG